MINRLPGLRPLGDRPSVSGTNKGRVQVTQASEMRTPGLTPTARPVDAYARPQAPAQGNDMLQLAQALGQINPSLSNLLESEATARRTHAENRATRKLGGMTYEQHREYMRSGAPEMNDPWFKAASMRLFGERQAIFRTNQLTQDYATSFDKENGNLDEFISSAIAQDLEEWGGNEHFMGAYEPLMGDFRGRATAQHTADVSEIMVNQNKDGIYEVFYGTASRMRSDGAIPAEIVSSLHSRYEGNRNLLNVPYQDQDREWVRMAEAFAEQGDLEMVEALLNTPRTGADGTQLGALSANRNFAAASASIISNATRVHEENNRSASVAAMTKFSDDARNGVLDEASFVEFTQANPGVYTEAGVVSIIDRNRSALASAQAEAARAQAEASLETQAFWDRTNLRSQNLGLVESNRVPFIQPATVRNERGENITVSVEQQETWLAEDINQQVEVTKDQNGLTDQQAFDLRTAQFTMAGLNNPQWESVLSAGPVAANSWSLSGEAPPSLVEGAELYVQLHEKSPVLLQRHIRDTETRRFYEAYRTAVTLGRMEPSQAYSHAANLIRNPPIDNPMTSLSRDDLEAVVRGIGNGNEWFQQNPLDGFTPNNEGYVSDWIWRSAQEYSAMGTMTASQAKEEAQRQFLERHTAINGQWVDTSDRNIPPNFEEMARTVIEAYAADFPDEDGGLDPSELTLRADNNGVWQIVYRGLIPIPVEDPQRRYVTLHSMQQALDARSIAALEALEQAQAQNQQNAAEDADFRERMEANRFPNPDLQFLGQ